MTDETLLRGFMTEAARNAKGAYQTVLGAVLLIEAAVGIALLAAPLSVSRLLGLADDTATVWPRFAGLLLLLLVIHMQAGRAMPAAAKLLSLAGFVGRTVLGLFLISLWGRFAIAGVLWLAAAIVLATYYFRYFQAEVMNRP